MIFFLQKRRSAKNAARQLCFLVLMMAFCFPLAAQRQVVSLNNDWQTSLDTSSSWKSVNVPHNWDDYYGYRRLLHGNLHGSASYKKSFSTKQAAEGRQFFLFFEGVGSYATVFLNGKAIGKHAGGRTSFTLNVTGTLNTNGKPNELLVKVDHPANIQDLPWVCGGCSDERGFSEGSQPLGIFRSVYLVTTNDVRISPFGIHAWADITGNSASLHQTSTVKNYSAQPRNIEITSELIDAKKKVVATTTMQHTLQPNDSLELQAKDLLLSSIHLWDTKDPYLYTIVSTVKEKNKVLDKAETEFGFRTMRWDNATHQFTLNGKPVFINGIAEYEHLLGQSHAFTQEEINARMKWLQAAGFNAFRDGHQPHNLLYGKWCNEKGILWWTQLSAHIWYDTKAFRENFKSLLRDWVLERRNDPAVMLWGLQNESKLPKEFAEECTAIIRSLDPTASTQRLVTTCNGGEGTDWDVPQNWTGTYGGNPDTYGSDLKKQILVGEYGAWRTLDLHTEGGFVQNGALSEDRMVQLMEKKVRLAESVKDSVAGHFFWLLSSHDNPGRVQGGEGFRELDRIGPVNYKGMLTPWEEPTDAYYMFRSNYAPKETEPMVYIVSHTWPNRWMTPGIKDSIYVYSNCDEVELFNDVDGASLGRKKRNGIGTHFQWDHVNIQYNVLYAVGYVGGKAVAKDNIVLMHLPQAPNFDQLNAGAKNLTKVSAGYHHVYRINCGGDDYTDENNKLWVSDRHRARSWGNDFSDVPNNFASQRRSFAPLTNSKDWPLFQNFRYGRDKLLYNFKVVNGEYLVDLYFTEPWLGIGGGMDATGMRMFDVAINDKTALKNLDIWKEAGTNKVLRKSVVVNVTDGNIRISFPHTAVGQAIISAIAISSKQLQLVRSFPTHKNMRDWMDIGDKQFASQNICFNSLPSELFGCEYYQLDSSKETKKFSATFSEEVDFYLAIRQGVTNRRVVSGFENTNTKIITDEAGGTSYDVYKTRFEKGAAISLDINKDIILCMQPANKMQPAYDLKPNTSYRPGTATVPAKDVLMGTVNGRETLVFKANNSTIEWPINIGAADIYSMTIRYSNETGRDMKGLLQVLAADGTVMKTENITFTQSREGKWSYITTNTGSMINAGNYRVRITAQDAVGVGVSGLDVQ